ncbi:hypothetical protein [Streptosporangium sp. 'caverna']|uniref:hypothetical protein n=1 Tax=Streptosporangium sp. 'caverna' TaxID=2202249 RepID=UPI000D7D7519|nr:hypothetical protein [Streptosporangium sp. 'caverna']AWS47180.1 hypothetical protein DKM19_43670 [Streptosporangium sp. 'caverna']
MNDDLEDVLRRTLGHASQRAPQAPSNLSSQVMTHSIRRRTRVQTLVAALAVAVVASGAVVTVRGAGDDPAPPVVNPTQAPSSVTATPSPSGKQAFVTPEPIEKVWPQAVWKIPAKLPGIRKYQPRIFIDDRTLLLETWGSFEKADAIYAYDLDSGQVRKIADIRTPKGVFSSGYTAGAGRIVWQTVDEVDGNGVTEFWSVPITGGQPTVINTAGPVKGVGEHLTVVGDKLAFSLFEGGVFTIPLGGGTVEPVAGADRHHILRWPWVGTPGEYAQNHETSFEDLLNVETGETSKAVVRPGEQNVRCGVTTCVGERPGSPSFYRLRDGSQERDLPGSAFRGLAADRFQTVFSPVPRGGQYLIDLVTGESGDLGLSPPGAKGQSIVVQLGIGDSRLVSYPIKDEHVVIDLAKIR